MTTPLTLTPGHRPDGTAVLTVTGEIDMSNSDSLAEALDATPGQVVLDLTAVEYLDSAGLAVLFTRADRLEVIATDLLIPVLTVSGLAEITMVQGAGPGTPDSG
ncbi:STAS domain-containing protein [Streptomyces sp. NPDC096152]|uniref:STAS domain-containing protein n=1 Tax=Streptomyces sp. NPDC096152 TaxID=3366078 RepID=UPI0037F4E6F6